MSLVLRVLSCLLLLLSTVVGSAQFFQSPHKVPLAGDPYSVAVADLNNDGAPDLIIGFGDQVTPQALQIYLSSGGGSYTFASQINLPTGNAIYCKTADLNGDGKIDIVCPPGPSIFDGTVLVYLGNGDGTFQQVMNVSLGAFSGNTYLILGVADMNGDGHPDVIIGPSSGYSTGYMLLGDGTGHFNVSWFAINGSSIYTGQATIADVNGDGIPDLLEGVGPAVLFGKGDGTFTGGFAPSNTGYCTYADFEKVGRLSAACTQGNNSFQIFHANTDGTFNIASPVSSFTFPNLPNPTYPLQAIDINGDGILDLVIINPDGLLVAMGKPGLQFDPPIAYAAGSTIFSRYGSGSFVDMNGDGYPDFISTGPGAVYITYGTSSGAFRAPVLNQYGTGLNAAITADFNGDGAADVIAIGSPGIGFLAGNGDGTFAAPVPIAVPAAYSSYTGGFLLPLVGDFNGDGKPDFIYQVGNSTNQYSYLLYPGNGNGSFSAAITAQGLAAISPANGIVVADLNGDHKDDIAQVQTQGTNLSVYLSQGDGTFDTVTSTFPNTLYTIGGALENTNVAFADFNGDSKLDAVIYFADHAIIMTGSGNGSFTTSSTVMQVPPITGFTLITNVIPVVCTGDFDGDGKQDVAVFATYITYISNSVRYSSALWVYFGNGDGTFTQPVLGGMFLDRTYSGLLAGDFNHTGKSDLVLYQSGFPDQMASLLSVITPQPNRTFSPESVLLGGDTIQAVYLGDFNRDGLTDLMISDGGGPSCTAGNNCANDFTVLLNSGPAVTGTLQTSPQPSVVHQIYTATASLIANGSTATQLSGNITFTLDGTALPPVALSNNTAAITISTNLTVGSHALTATWPGDTNFPPLTLSAIHTIIDYPTTTTLTCAPNPVGVLGTVALTATVTSPNGAPAGAVTFTDGAAVIGSANLAGVATLTYIPQTTGAHVITATYPANGDYAASFASCSENVQPLPTTSQLSFNPLPYGGMPFQLVVNVAPVTPVAAVPTGIVTFTINGTTAGTGTLTNGVATFNDSGIPAGHYLMGCSYSGDSLFAASDCSPGAAQIAPPIGVVTLSSSRNPSPQLTPIAFTAALTSNGKAAPAGDAIVFTLTSNGATVAQVSTTTDAAGMAVYTSPGLQPGTYAVTAFFPGNSDLQNASSPTLTQIVVSPVPSRTTLTVNPNPATYGTPIVLTATVAASTPPGPGTPTGTVTFYLDGAAVASTALNAVGTSAYTINGASAGSHSISCTYSGDNGFLSNTCSPAQVTVTAAATALTLTSAPNPSYAHASVTFTAHLSVNGTPAPAGNTIVLTLNGQTINLITDSTGTATYTTATLPPGVYPVTAAFAATTNLLASSASSSQTVNIIPTATTLAVSPSAITSATPATLTATVAPLIGIGLTGTVAFYEGTTALGTSPLNASANLASLNLGLLTPGTHTFTCIYSGDTSFASSQCASITVTVVAQDFTFSSSAPSLTVQTGHARALTLSLTSIGSFNGKIDIACKPPLPTYVTCELPGSPVVIGAGSTASTPLTIDTNVLIDFYGAASPNPTLTRITFAVLFPFALWGLARRRLSNRNIALSAIFGFASLLSLSILTACGDHSPASTPPGTYTIPLTATGYATNGTPIQHGLSVTLIVTP